MPVTPFVIFFSGRSGSTHLVSLLASHPNIQAHEELFVTTKIAGAEAQIEWARKILRPAPDKNLRASGFKTKFEDVLDLSALRELLHEVQSKIILLQRRNLAKQVVSWSNADRLYIERGKWNLSADETKLGPIAIDPDEFHKRLRLLERAEEEDAQVVLELELPVLHLMYEDLMSHSNKTLTKLLRFLGVRKYHLSSSVLKSTSDDLRVALTNFEELRSRYVGTRFEAMFDEVLQKEAG